MKWTSYCPFDGLIKGPSCRVSCVIFTGGGRHCVINHVSTSLGHHVSTSLGHHVSTSLGHHVSTSLGHHVSTSLGHHVSTSLGHHVSTSLGHHVSTSRSPVSTFRSTICHFTSHHVSTSSPCVHFIRRSTMCPPCVSTSLGPMCPLH